MLEHLSAAGRVELAADILGAVWAFHVSGTALQDGAQKIAACAHKSLLLIGKSLDSSSCLLPLLPFPAAATDRMTSEEPAVVQEMPDRLVIFKPPGWEVKRGRSRSSSAKILASGALLCYGDVSAATPAPEVNVERQLSTYIQAIQAPATISSDSRHQYGFLHRLDVPSSGLILVAKTYEAYYDLSFQLHAGRVQRDYTVLCHGWVCPEQEEVSAPIHWTNGSAGASTVQVQGGKPARTHLQVICHMLRGQQRFSLLAVRIATGRRHQIRVHLKHLGHPTVCDGKYTVPEVFVDDLQWCPRNFLHRCRLSFRDLGGTRRFATEPLPEDLARVLKQLAVHTAFAKTESWSNEALTADAETGDAIAERKLHDPAAQAVGRALLRIERSQIYLSSFEVELMCT
eukprot:gb/GFBE01056830.1/.p1 GENE.gb/GFBE01056830.1/~~gb/GFBE01056830.1/.p1  ORF type:complete len:400 (+),score=50.07 gb/GFBE01056830.1/:1-1200(+)